MPLPTFLQRFLKGASGQRPGAEAVSLSQADFEAVRVRARRRLIGMAVLVGAGVIGFPWLFETKPRPMAMDIAVVQQGASTPAAMVGTGKPGVQAQVKSVSKPQPAPAEPREEFVETPAKSATVAPKVVPKVADTKVAEVKVADKKAVEPKPASVPSKAAPTKPTASVPALKSVASADKPASAAPIRYVVQIGAYSDVPSAREMRMKAEKLGLKTYSQVIGTDANKKIRVRLGPFEDKSAADKAMAVLRKAGMSGALLTL